MVILNLPVGVALMYFFELMVLLMLMVVYVLKVHYLLMDLMDNRLHLVNHDHLVNMMVQMYCQMYLTLLYLY